MDRPTSAYRPQSCVKFLSINQKENDETIKSEELLHVYMHPTFHNMFTAFTCEVEGEGNESMIFAEDAERFFSLYQREKVIRHRLSVEEVVHAQQKVPAGLKEKSSLEQTEWTWL